MARSTRHHFKSRGVVLSPTDLAWEGWPQAAEDAGLTTIALHPTPARVSVFLASDEGKAFLDHCAQHGLEIEYELHAMSHLLPRELFSSDPAMFRMTADGDRVPDANLCVSSPRAMEVLEERCLEVASTLRPTTRRYFLWGDDGADWCRCPACRGLTDSDQALLVSNRIASALRTTDPQATVAYLAYLNTLAPPRQVKPEAGVFLEYAPIRRRYDLPYRVQEGEEPDQSPTCLRDLLEVFPAATAHVLEYWLDLSRFSHWQRPAPRLPWRRDVLEADLDYYAGLGIRSVTSFGVFLDTEYVENHGRPPVDEYGASLAAWKPLPAAKRSALPAWTDAISYQDGDPYLAALRGAGKDLPRLMMEAAPPLMGEPAFDPEEMDRRAADLTLPTGSRFEHPLLERAVRIGLAHIDATFVGDHPKYGVGAYSGEEHDGFPPTIIATVDALTLWDMTARAEELFGYWLRTFVDMDGTFRYYGPSLAEYGQVLTTARRLMDRGGSKAWLGRHAVRLFAIARRLLDLIGPRGDRSLITGSPEADTREEVAAYFHGNAWVARGLEDWSVVLSQRLQNPTESQAAQARSLRLASAVTSAIRRSWPDDKADWWLRPMEEREEAIGGDRPSGGVTDSRLGSYTNYRYWPELLSSGILDIDQQLRLARARLAAGGQILGMSRFEGHLDDWPLAEYLDALRALQWKDEFRVSLWGHILFHQAAGHMTAYEQVSLPPGKPRADYCLPCQLVAVRAARRPV